jgi:hypothetical protein
MRQICRLFLKLDARAIDIGIGLMQADFGTIAGGRKRQLLQDDDLIERFGPQSAASGATASSRATCIAGKSVP